MAKKSIIAGEYIIEIADNGHVDVMRVFSNAMATMTDIAKSKGFAVEEKWNTQDLGRHLVKEFGDGKSAQFGDITINRLPNSRIEIYQECKNTIDALRNISDKLGYVYDAGWNTQTFGAKLAEYLSEHKEEADKVLKTRNQKKVKTEASNVTKASENEENSFGSNLDESSDEKRTYFIRLKVETAWRFDNIELENATDEDIAEGFEDQKAWTSIIGETSNLYCLKEDIDTESLYGYEEEDINKLASIIGDNGVNSGDYYPDAEEEFSLIITDEDGNEIDSIDSSDIPSFCVEYPYQINLDEYDGDDEKYSIVDSYLKQNDVDSLDAVKAFEIPCADTWFWLNAQKCTMDDVPVYRLEIQGDFDPGKLSFKKILIEEITRGVLCAEIVKEIMYDGKILEIEEYGSDLDSEATNLVIKMNSDGDFPENVYDMTNYEEA